MELKPYQKHVIENLEEYLFYVQKHKKLDKAFNQYWEDKIGRYDPVNGTGMTPYKNNIPSAAHVCIKVPTAGGKTFIAVNALHSIFAAFDASKPKAVIWLVPWSNLLDQTVEALSDPNHPYRQKLNALFNHRVEVYKKEDLLQGSNFNPTVVKDQLTIVVMSFASLRARKKEDRKVYQENGALESFASAFKNTQHLLQDENVDDTALINVLRYLNPVLVVDESHNAESKLSIDMLKNLNPSVILDLTATPKENSNIVSLVPAMELKKEHMVKLPVIVYNSHDKTEVINNALHLQRKLEIEAKKSHEAGGKYIRPIVLFQAQPKTAKDNTTFEKLKEQLLSLGIPENQIKIKTANINELKDIDLMSEDCEVRYIITINALKEGWDCPFAYILASLANKSSAIDVEQILGRVLRQPYVQKHDATMLNLSYVLTASTKFNETLQGIVKGLQESGFSGKDYRKIDAVTDKQREAEVDNAMTAELFSEQITSEESDEEVIDQDRVDFSFDDEQSTKQPIQPIADIELQAKEENLAFEQQADISLNNDVDISMFSDLGDKVKRYKVKENHREEIKRLKIPQFYLKVSGSDIFGTDEKLLNRESLLKGFKLSTQDININFDNLDSDLYKVDLEEGQKDDFRPSFAKIENTVVKETVADYILAKPKESQSRDITYQLTKIIGNLSPIPDQEIKKYIERILAEMETDQLQDVLARKESYKDKIKKKIKALSNSYAESRFNDLINVQKIVIQPNWSLSEEIIPGNTSSSISNALYEQEGSMNDFEEKVILAIGTLPNVKYWHRNLERGKGMLLNGFINHYPDFILKTERGNTIVIESKGDHLNNDESAAKRRLGEKWSNLAGPNFSYFMVFENKEVEGAYTLDKAVEIINQL